jgi:MerR family mercuric resistance operon transcriptional regulator
MEPFTVGELARRADVNRETVRYYERLRLLPRPSRTISGYRLFSDDALRRLSFIRHAKELGFSLSEIKELLALRVNSLGTCDRVQERTRAKIANIDRKIRSLKQVKDALSELVDACARRRKSNECPILDSLDANGWFEPNSAIGETRPRRPSRSAREVAVRNR